jgi:hypothetical protein
MHPLHDYIAGLVASQVRARHAVVIYDARCELEPFFAEAAGEPDETGLSFADFGGVSARLFTISGSLLQARVAVEPLTAGDQPQNVVIYAPGLSRGDPKNSLLLEIEKAGALYQPPALRSNARTVLRKRFDDVAIDGMLQSEALTYDDLAALCRGEDGGGSLLRTVFGASDPVKILTAWLLDAAHDIDLDAKGAWGELRSLVSAKLGFSLPADGDAVRLRAITARYLLANEFRNDLATGAAVAGPAAARLSEVPTAPGKDELKAVLDVTLGLRERDAGRYLVLADRIQQELLLNEGSVPGDALGAVDTFRFEEVAAAHAVVQLVADRNIDDAAALIAARGQSFWVAQDAERKVLWDVCQQMIDVCVLARRIRAEVDRGPSGGAKGWIDRYAAAGDDGWFKLDSAQRSFETHLASLEVDIDPAAIATVRAEYEDAVRRMTEGFVKALEAADWVVSQALHHTRIWQDVVSARPKPTAYIFVDAMRYEMGAELAERISGTNEVQLRPALAALPSITPIGMAALLPGSAATFSVVRKGPRIGSSIDGVFLPDRSSRQKFLEGKVAGVVSINLDDVISVNAKQLQKLIGAAPLIAIHSTDIDGAGENPITTAAARRIMSHVIGDLARCLRNLAAAGVEDVVITSDHGHLFFAGDRPASMRMEAPGGDTADLHRRCWIGKGGGTPPGAVRVSGAKLGYNTDLEFVFPISTAVFKAGGDLAFHHGGPSLQEMVVPVLTVKARPQSSAKAVSSGVSVTHEFDAITNRIFTIKVELTGVAKGLFDQTLVVRALVVSEGHEVAQAALAVGGDLHGGRLALQPQTPVSVGFILTDETASSAQIQILDAETDRVLWASDGDIPVKLGL